jgi:hypothetical protein
MSKIALRLLIFGALGTALYLAIAFVQSLSWTDLYRLRWRLAYVELYYDTSFAHFALNVLLYSLLVYSLFVTLRTTRRMLLYNRASFRVRRMRCATCGYPTGGSQVCTECGRCPTELPSAAVKSLVV